jgi:L-asparaginase II
MPLSRLAMMWARLASGMSGASTEMDSVLTRIFAAMSAHPEMISGTGRCDLAIVKATAGDCVAKVGVDGIYTMGIRSRGVGIVVKIADGNPTAQYATAVAVLRKLGVVNDGNGSGLAGWDNPKLRNLRGIPVGHIDTSIRLEIAAGEPLGKR